MDDRLCPDCGRDKGEHAPLEDIPCGRCDPIVLLRKLAEDAYDGRRPSISAGRAAVLSEGADELERLRHYADTCGGTDNDGRCPMRIHSG